MLLEQHSPVLAQQRVIESGPPYRVADLVRRRIHPGGAVTFIIDRNINYTNVCRCRCAFCAFYREESDPVYNYIMHFFRGYFRITMYQAGMLTGEVGSGKSTGQGRYTS